MKFLDWVTTIGPRFQKWINIIGVAGVILGQLLFIIGSVTLGLGGLFLFLGSVLSVVLNLVPAWARWSGAMALMGFAPGLFDKLGNVLARVKDIVVKLIDKFIQLPEVQQFLKDLGIEASSFEELWTKAVDLIKDKFGDWIDLITGDDGIVKALSGLKSDFKDFKKEIQPIIDALKTFITLAGKALTKISELRSRIGTAKVIRAIEGEQPFPTAKGFDKFDEFFGIGGKALNVVVTNPQDIRTDFVVNPIGETTIDRIDLTSRG